MYARNVVPHMQTRKTWMPIFFETIWKCVNSNVKNLVVRPSFGGRIDMHYIVKKFMGLHRYLAIKQWFKILLTLKNVEFIFCLDLFFVT